MTQTVPHNSLGLFAKYWEPGKVKTRLARSLGEVKAARVYETFVAASIARLSVVDCCHVLAYSPSNETTRAAFTAADIPGWSLAAQAEGDLGCRMSHFFDSQFNKGAKSVVLVGTDSPNLPVVEVEAAFEHLETSEVVIGPTEDGGYYLVGAVQKTPPIFANIPWSTPEVLTSTLEQISLAGLSYTLLDSWYDVDEIYDLHRLIEDLQDDLQEEPALRVLLNQILEVIES
ncbi:MAG TPA: glycosyltransferase [Planctomycetaceae bacterium]|nr:glycosyltransferase [Planctomycetaceae bacterium]